MIVVQFPGRLDRRTTDEDLSSFAKFLVISVLHLVNMLLSLMTSLRETG